MADEESGRIALPTKVMSILLGVNLIFIQDILSSTSLIGLKLVALVCFCIALPFLAGSALIREYIRFTNTILPHKSRKWWMVINGMAYLASEAGITFILFDASIFAGIVFIILLLVMNIIFAKEVFSIERDKDKIKEGPFHTFIMRIEAIDKGRGKIKV